MTIRGLSSRASRLEATWVPDDRKPLVVGLPLGMGHEQALQMLGIARPSPGARLMIFAIEFADTTGLPQLLSPALPSNPSTAAGQPSASPGHRA